MVQSPLTAAVKQHRQPCNRWLVMSKPAGVPHKRLPSVFLHRSESQLMKNMTSWVSSINTVTPTHRRPQQLWLQHACHGPFRPQKIRCNCPQCPSHGCEFKEILPSTQSLSLGQSAPHETRNNAACEISKSKWYFLLDTNSWMRAHPIGTGGRTGKQLIKMGDPETCGNARTRQGGTA